MPTPNSGDRTVKFLRPEGLNSFADGAEPVYGICEVCHTQTRHFRYLGAGSDPLHTNMGPDIPGSDCTECHKHMAGFAGMGDGAHETHVIDENGPQLDCADCHGSCTPPLLTNLAGDSCVSAAATDVCNNCHSLDDVDTAKDKWHDDPGTWVAEQGEEGYCGSCHDDTPGNSEIAGGGDLATNIAGDKINYGYFLTGHGRPTEYGKFANLSWQEAGHLLARDFNYGNVSAGGATSISSVAHTAGESTAVITLNSQLSIGDIDTDTLAADSNSIYDEYGINAASTDARPITEIEGVPTITVVQGVDGHDRLAVWFSERVYANNDATGTLQPADFDDSNLGGKSITDVDHEFGSPRVTLELDGDIAAADIDNALVTLAAEGTSIYDITGNPAPINGVMLTDGIVSSIVTAEGVIGSTTLKVTFESQVYANDDETGALDSTDFTYGDVSNPGATGIFSVSHSAGSSVAILTLNATLDSGAADIGNDTIAAASDSIFGPSRGNFPLGTDAVTITGSSAPSITEVEGSAGYDKLVVFFSEGVYTDTGQSGELVPADFALTDNDLRTITNVDHVAGQATAILTLSSPVLDADDFSTDSDTLAAANSAIFNNTDNPAGTTPVDLITWDCPEWDSDFQIENESQYSSETNDETGLLIGTVGNPNFVFPVPLDNDVYNGDEAQDTWVDIDNNKKCMNVARQLTIEARVKPTEVDRGVGDNTFNRIFARRGTFKATILNTDYRGDDIPQRAGKSSIEIKYRVQSRHTCPQPQWPADPYSGNSVWMHQISSSIENYPLYNDHWYLIMVVFNSDKTNVPGSNGNPVDIFIDDQGTDAYLYAVNPTPGDPTLNPDYEQWAGYKNATVAINGSSSCQWGALPGDYLRIRDFESFIGADYCNSNNNPNCDSPMHSQLFEGQIDWVTWKPVADYTGVSDPPK